MNTVRRERNSVDFVIASDEAVVLRVKGQLAGRAVRVGDSQQVEQDLRRVGIRGQRCRQPLNDVCAGGGVVESADAEHRTQQSGQRTQRHLGGVRVAPCDHDVRSRVLQSDGELTDEPALADSGLTDDADG